MSDATRDAYLATVDPRFVAIVRALDDAVTAAQPGLDTRVAYGALTYALDGDFRHFICAVGATKKAAALRFPFGSLLDDPHGLLVAGGSPLLRSVYFRLPEEVEPEVLGAYVRQAGAHLEEYRALCARAERPPTGEPRPCGRSRRQGA